MTLSDGFADDFFRTAESIDRSGIDEIDAVLDRRLDRGNGFRLLGSTPHPAADGPGAQGNTRHIKRCADDAGTLHHVGITSSFSWDRRAELVGELAPLRENALDGHPWSGWADWAAEMEASGQRVPGATSRWNRGKDLSWEPLRAERVVEVAYDHLQGDRFRHATTFKRWRPDKPPDDCRYDQLEVTKPYELEKVFGAGRQSSAP